MLKLVSLKEYNELEQQGKELVIINSFLTPEQPHEVYLLIRM